MVAIVSGNSLGLSLTSLATLGQGGVSGNATQGRSGELMYVNASTGNLVLQNRDELLVGRGLDVASLRTYNSQGQFNDDNGDNWSNGFYSQQLKLAGVRNQAGSTLTRTSRDGAQAVYAYDAASGRYTSSEGAGALDSISFDASSSRYVWTDGDSGLTEQYESSATGRLVSSADTNGQTVDYTYNADGLLASVRSGSGETTHYDYTGTRLDRIRTELAADNMGNEARTLTRVRYGYDSSNRLESVTVDLSPDDDLIDDGAVYRTTYTYDGSSKRVASISQTDGTVVSIGYTEVGGAWRVASVRDALDHVTTYTYDGSLGASAINAPANSGALITVEQQTTTHSLNTGLLSRPVLGWNNPSLRENLNTGSASLPQVRLDSAGKGLAVWILGADLYSSTYNQNNDTWGVATKLDGELSGNPSSAHLSMSDNGNALVTWIQEGNVHARRAIGGVWDGVATIPVLENAAGAVTSLTGAINDAGRAVVTFLQHDGTRSNLFANVFDGTSWQAAASNIDDAGSPNDNDINSPALPRVAIDPQGNATITWAQRIGSESADSLYLARYTATSGLWSDATSGVLEAGTAAVDDHQIAFDTNGNGLVTYRVGNSLYAKAYTRSSNTWGAATTLSTAATGAPSLAMSSNGNGVVTWIQAGSAYGRIFTNGAWVGTSPQLLESWPGTAFNPVATINNVAQATVVFILTSDTVNNVYANHFNPRGSTGASLIEGNSNTVIPAGNLPSVAINADHMVVATWLQKAGAEANESVYSVRYNLTNPPYYTLPVGGSWETAANALYGTPALAGQLSAGRAYVAGMRISGMASSLVNTVTTTVPAYYTVLVGDTWEAIAQAVYGTADPAAVAALRTALGDPALTAGLHLTVPANLGYSHPTAAGLTLRVTDALDFETTYTNDEQGRLTKIEAPAVGGVRQAQSFAYNARGDLSSFTDARGNTTVMAYDDRGNQTLQRDELGNTISRSYDSRNQLLTETVYLQPDPDGAQAGQPAQPSTTRHVYDSAGKNRLRFSLSPEGRVTEHVYNGHGERTATIQYTASLYNVATLGVSDVPSEAQLAAWAAAQDPALVQRSDMSYDFRGQLAGSSTGVAPTGGDMASLMEWFRSQTRYHYDEAGRLLVTASMGQGEVTQYVYDGLGRVIFAASGGNEVPRLTTYQYDDAQNKTLTTSNNGLLSTSTYDAAGRLVSVLQSSEIGANLGETRYFYDDDNRLLMTQDPTGVRQWLVYDEAGRNVATVDADGSLTELVHNANNQVIQRIAYATRVQTARLVDANGLPTGLTLAQIRPADSVDDRESRVAFDKAGRLVQTVDAEGRVNDVRYDGASRVIETQAHVSRADSSFSLGASGEPLVVDPDSGDRVVRSFYSADGLLLGNLDAEGYYTANAYDGAGRLVATTRYAQRMVGSPANELTPPAVVSGAPFPAGAYVQTSVAELYSAAGRDQTTRFFHNTKGQLAAQVDAENHLTANTYDLKGRLLKSIRYARALTAPLTAATRLSDLVGVTDPEDQTTHWEYDALGRLSQETTSEGIVTSYGYDLADNLVSTTRALGQADQRVFNKRFDLQGRLIAELSGEGGARLTAGLSAAQVDAIWAQYATTHTYDMAGRRTSSTDAVGNTTLFFYNHDGQLTYSVNALGQVQEQRYNSFNQLEGTVTYGTLIDLAGLQGGLTDATLLSRFEAIRNLSVDSGSQMYFDKDGRVSQVVDAEGLSSSFSYTSFGELLSTSVLKTDGSVRVDRHEYDRRGQETMYALDGVDANSPLDVWEYDAFGRVVSSTRGAGTLLGANPNANTHQQRYDRLGRVIQTVESSDGATRLNAYDAFGRLYSSTNVLNQTTTYRYDQAARRTTVTSPEGIALVTVHSAHGQTYSVEVADQEPTVYEYDHDGNLLKTTTPLTETRNTYDRVNRLETTTDANGNVVHYTYDQANRVLSVTVDPDDLAITTNYRYDAKGQASWVQSPNGVWTQTEYDLNGRVKAVTVDPRRSPDAVPGAPDDHQDGLALRTTYGYDERDNVVTLIDPRGTVTRYEYDHLGRRIRERVDPDGLNLTRVYAYDLKGNLVSTMVGKNQSRTLYVLDAHDRVRATLVMATKNGASDVMANVELNDYDAEGKVIRSVRLATPVQIGDLLRGADNGEVRWADIESRLVFNASIDAVAARRYDADGRLRFTVNGLGAVVEYVYDSRGNVVDEISYVNEIDDISQLGSAEWMPVPEPSDLDLRVHRSYDDLNRVATQSNALGQTTWFAYDGNGNLVEKLHHAAWSGGADPAHDLHERYAYDAANRLAYAINGAGELTRNEYDDSGNVIRHRAYAGRARGALESAEAWAAYVAAGVPESAADRVTHRYHDAANRLSVSVDAMRVASLNVYDDNGNVVRQTTFAQPVPTGAALGIEPPSLVGSPVDRTSHAVYDAAGRLRYSVNAGGSVTRETYDAVGNAIETLSYGRTVALQPDVVATEADVLAELNGPPPPQMAPQPADRLSIREFDAARRLVNAIDALGHVVHNTYDALGQLLSSTAYAEPVALYTEQGERADIRLAVSERVASFDEGREPQVDRRNRFSYDAAGHMVSSKDALDQEEKFAYNALGQKISFTNKRGHSWSYHYDEVGRLSREEGPAARATVLSEHVINGVRVDGEPNTPYRPVTRFIYDGLGNLVQRWRYASYEWDGRSETEDAAYYGSYSWESRLETEETVYEYDAVGRQTGVIFPKVSLYDRSSDPLATHRQAVDVSVGWWNGRASQLMASLRHEGEPVKLRTETVYNVFGEAVANKDVAGNWSYKTYDQNGFVAYTVDAEGYVSGYGRNAFGEVERLTRYAGKTELPAAGRTAPLASDIELALSSESHDVDRTLRTAYDRMGRAVQVSQSVGFVYDSSAPANSTDLSGEKVTRSTYNAFGEKVEELALINAMGHWARTTHYFDVLGREVAVVDALGYVTERGYDAVGNVDEVTEYANAVTQRDLDRWTRGPADANDRRTSSGHDLLNRKLTDTQVGPGFFVENEADRANGIVTRYAYDEVGNLVSTTDAEGGVTYSYYDALGRVKAVVGPPSGPGTPRQSLTEFQRDRFGNIVVSIQHAEGTVADAENYTIGSYAGARFTFNRYDNLGRVTETTDPMGSNRYMSYDAAGNVAKQWQDVTDQAGVGRTTYKLFEYDKLGQQIRVTEPGSEGDLDLGLLLGDLKSAKETWVDTPEEEQGWVWAGANKVDLDWSGLVKPNLSDPDSKDVTVTLTYRNKGVPQHFSGPTGSRDVTLAPQSFSTREAAGGVSISWLEDAQTKNSEGGITAVLSVKIVQVINGQEVVLHDGALEASKVTAPTVLPVQSEMNVKGSKFWWSPMTGYSPVLRMRMVGETEWQDVSHLIEHEPENDTFDIAAMMGREYLPSEEALEHYEYELTQVPLAAGGLTYGASGVVTYKAEAAVYEPPAGLPPVPGGLRVGPGSVEGGASVVEWNAPAGVRAILKYRASGHGEWTTAVDAQSLGEGEPMQFVLDGMVGDYYEVALLLEDYPWEGDYDGSAEAYLTGVLDMTSDVPDFTDYTSPYRPGYYHERVYEYTEQRNVPVSIAVGALEQHYNAFGEVESRGRIGANGTYEEAERMAYDAGGRLWRTNQGDGIDKVMLHDLLGRVTAEISITSGDPALRNSIMGNAVSAHMAYGVHRTDITYDDLGRATKTVLAERYVGGAVGTVELAENTTAKIVSTASSSTTAGQQFRRLPWTGSNQVSVRWSDLRRYGNGDVRVTVRYMTAEVPGTVIPSIEKTHTELFSPGEVGANLSWGDPAGPGGLSRVVEVIVEKFDVHGEPRVIHRIQGGVGTEVQGKRIVIPRSNDTVDDSEYPFGLGEIDVKMRLLGQTDWVPVKSNTTAMDFGRALVIDGAGFADGEYEYQVWYTGPQDGTIPPDQLTPKSTGRFFVGPAMSANVGDQRPVTERAEIHQDHDRWGNVISVSDPRSIEWKTRYAYDWGNRRILEESPPVDGGTAGPLATRSSRYDRLGQLVINTDAMGTATRYRYDLTGNRVSTAVDGVTLELHDYNTFGERVRSTDGNGLVTFYTLDHAGRLLGKRTQTEIAGGIAAQETYTYDELGRRRSVTNRAGEVTRYDYDARGNVTTVTKSKGTTVSVTQRNLYDANNRKTVELDANGFSSAWTYDYFGKLTAHQDLGGVAYSYQYDGRAQLILQTNLRGQSLKYTRDGADQVLRIEDGALHQLSDFTYDLAGNRLTEVIWQANPGTPTQGHTYQSNMMAYDAAGRLRLVTGLNGARVEYEYDANGNRVHQWGRYHKGVAADGSVDASYFDYASAYDKQNRQVIAEGVGTGEPVRAWNPAAPHLAPVVSTPRGNLTINAEQGHYIQYDGNGNRVLDVSYGRKVVKPAPVGALLYNWVPNSEDPMRTLEKVFAQEYYDDGRSSVPRLFQLGEILQDEGGYYVASMDWTGSGEDVGLHHVYFTGRDMQYPNGTDNPFVGQDGYVAETYGYDEHQRIENILRDGVEIEHRGYDGAGRLAQSSPRSAEARDARYWAAMGKPEGGDTTQNSYDALGRIDRVSTRHVHDATQLSQAYHYDKAGNVVALETQTRHPSRNQWQNFTYELARYEGYQQDTVSGVGGGGTGFTSNQYDANGRLVGITDAGKPSNNRSFVNDAQGLVLQSTQGGNVIRHLIVAGQVLGRYGMGINELDPVGANGAPNFVPINEFDSSFRQISGRYPNASPGSYQVQPGETLQTIAQSAYGDSKLWWKIADANGLSGNNDLRAGQTLNIPSATSSSNSADTYRPYDPSSVVGDTSPYMPAAGGEGCGTMGMVIMIIVAVVVTYLTAGALSTAAGGMFATSGASATAGTIAANAAVSAAVGSIASQVVGMAIGMQDKFNWGNVALAAVGGGLTAGINVTGFSPVVNAGLKSAIANAVTQQVAISIGLQKTAFSWTNVAAAAAGGAMARGLTDSVMGAENVPGKPEFGRSGGLVGSLSGVTNEAVARFAGAGLLGFAAGMTTAAARGGRVNVTQVATDAFGNALGSSLAGAMQSSPERVLPFGQTEPSLEMAALAGELSSLGRSDGYSFGTALGEGSAGATSAPLTEAQVRAMQGGAGPLTAAAAQWWVEFEDEPIGPAANGRQLPSSKEQIAASAAIRARVVKTASDFWGGTGEFSPTSADNRSFSSAMKDTGKAVWNLGVDVLAMAEVHPLSFVQRAGYKSIDIELPKAAALRATYDTPAFGLTMEVAAPFVPVSRLLGAPRSIGGAAFVEGKFVHDLKPLSNLELYGTAATRTPDEALQLLQRVGHDSEMLAQYRIVKLSDSEYSALSKDLGFDFDATYGRVPPRAPSVTFNGNIASKMADGSNKIPVYVRKEVFDSDEAIVQILSHEISETQELKYLAAKPLSTTEYRNLVRPDRVENLHWHAVKEGDHWLQRFRDMLAGKK